MKIALALLLLLARGPDEAARKKNANEHFTRGQKLYAAEKFEQALEEFKAGYSAYPAPAFLINIGQSYRQLGERKKAITLYQQYLDLQPSDDSLRPQVEKMIADLEREERVSAESSKPARAEPVRTAKVDLAPRPPPPAPAPAPVVVPKHEEPEPAAEESAWYGKWWVWTLAGVLVAGGVAAGVASSSSSSSSGVQPGSLGLVDGRR